MTLAIVGRPNVGKSALFNRIACKRIAIVDEAEGVTRDRIYAEAELFGFPFVLIDTGGIDPRSSDCHREQIRQQALKGIEEADVVVMVVDGQVGITDLDKELAEFLLKKGKPLTLAVNKIDSAKQEALVHEFYSLGITKIVGVSALQGFQIAELLETAWEKSLDTASKELKQGLKVSLIGRPNVGKSTLVNALLDEERCLVSPVAGTTRDNIDIPLLAHGERYVLIDTAGIRRKKSEHEAVEKFAALRTERAIERSDICLLILDAREGLTHQEKRIANTIERAGKSCIILLNKWDLVKGFRMEHCLEALKKESPFLAHCPTLFLSAATGRNLDQIFPTIARINEGRKARISTHKLNTFVQRAMQLVHPPMLGGKRLRIYYLTQVETSPPRFVLFVNHKNLLSESYKKYLLNRFRESFPFPGTPIEFFLKAKEPRKS